MKMGLFTKSLEYTVRSEANGTYWDEVLKKITLEPVKRPCTMIIFDESGESVVRDVKESSLLVNILIDEMIGEAFRIC